MLGTISAQEVDSLPQMSRFIAGTYVDFQVDNLGNIFVLTPDNQLKKYSASGDSLGVFNDVRRYGKIAYIDVTNPLKTPAFLPGIRHYCYAGQVPE